MPRVDFCDAITAMHAYNLSIRPKRGCISKIIIIGTSIFLLVLIPLFKLYLYTVL